MPGSPVRWVVFDAVDTLIEPSPSVGEAYWQIGRRFGSQRSPDEVRAAFRAAFVASEQTCFAPERRGQTSESEEHRRWKWIVTQVLPDVAEADACFDALWDHFAQPTSWRCFPDVEPTLQRLVSQGIQIATASNFDSRLHAVRAGLPPLQPLARCLVSSELGYRKPAAEFYRAVAAACSSVPHEMLFVGDDREGDVLAPRRSGWQSVWLERRTPRPDAVQSLSEILPLAMGNP